MIRHLVLFTWSDDTTPEHITAVEDGLRELESRMTVLERYSFGPDIAVNQGNADYAVMAEFASLDDYLTYRDDEFHKHLIASTIAPRLAARAAVQMEF